MRVPFLALVPVCVLLGVAAALFTHAAVKPLHLILAFIGALGAHVSVNALNEYDDFKTKLDFHTRPTPFSGGSGTLPRYPDKAPVALGIGVISLTVCLLIGIYFLAIRGVWLLPLGLLGGVTVVTYTRYLTKKPWLCLIAPGVGFGPCMVMGTAFALTGSYSQTALAASLVPFFLVSNLLLLNQFPDVEADQQVGRRHFPITIGRQASTRVFGLFLAGTYATIVAAWLLGIFPATAMIALATLVLAVPTFQGVQRHAADIPRLIPYMGRNVLLVLITPTLLAIGLMIGR